MTKNKKAWIILYFFIFMAPFSVSSYINNLVPLLGVRVLIVSVVAIIGCFFILRRKKVKITKESKIIIMHMFIPMVLSTILVAYNMVIINNENYYSYIIGDLPSRIINATLFLIIFLFANSLILESDTKKLNNIMKYYLIGIGILAIVGVWQFLNIYYSVPMFEMGTRTNIHGIGNQTNILFNRRLTSLANEPSYLAPFMIDGLIIGWFFMSKSKYWYLFASLLLFVLIFSFSGGGYVNIIVLCLLFIVIKKKKIILKNLVSLTLLGFCAMIAIYMVKDQLIAITYPFFGRLDSLISMKSARTFMSIMPFVWITQNSIFNILFGYGPGAFKYLSLEKVLPSGLPVHNTSNNIFGDVTYELGIIGLLSILIMFIRLIRVPYLDKSGSKESKVAVAIILHMMISSMYIADFFSPRFWVLLIIYNVLIIRSRRNSCMSKV